VALILDTGPRYASHDRNDADHASSRALIEHADEPLVVPSPVLVEVDEWIHARMQAGVLRALLDDVATGAYLIEDLTVEDNRRVRELCDTYADAGIGFVDAAVFAIVERFREPKLASLDRRHFGILRPRHVDHLQLVPDTP
jgi:hypothetical protein